MIQTYPDERLTAPPPQFRERRVRRPVGSAIAIVLASALNVALVAGAAWGFANPQRVDDQFTVWTFEPSTAISGYIDRANLTEHGQFLFLASEPVVLEPAAFEGSCGSRQEGVGILGCYHPSTQRIMLYDITDERLDGIEEVTAAHEMLHAAWDRLGAPERAELGTLLEAEAAKLAGDEAFAKRMEFYALTEPGERLNELHSIIATEVAEVSAELEAYFALYFADRQALVQLHLVSHAVFVENAARIDAVIAQLDALEAQIDADYSAYLAASDRLTADVAVFNRRARNGEFESEEQFNRERAALISRQDRLDADFAAIEALETNYKALLVELESLNAEAEDLNRSINIQPRSEEKTEETVG